MKFLPWPSFEDDEISAVVDVLRSGKVNQWTGEEVKLFEKEFAQYVGVNYGTTLANGSLALELALTAFGIKESDEIIVTPRSFVASATCICLKKAVPVFVDVDPISQNITLESIKGAITPKTRAVIAVNLSGWPCELDKIQKLCKEKDIFLIEDCAQAHGAAFKERKVGSFGDCAIYSFCQDKIMTTGGEGGILVTNDEQLRQKIWSLKDHGKSFVRASAQNHLQGFKWLVDSLGTNCRMTEMQAALGRVMLRKLDDWVSTRRHYAHLLDNAFQTVSGLRTTVPGKDYFHSYYKYYVFVEPEKLHNGWSRDRIISELNDAGIPCNTGICPEIYRESVFTKTPYKISKCTKGADGDYLEVAKQLGQTSIMFLVHPTLDIEAIQYTIDNVKKVLKKACR